MSKTVRYKLSEEQYTEILSAANQMGISVETLARQALFYTLEQAAELARKTREHSEGVKSLSHQTKEAEKALAASGIWAGEIGEDMIPSK